VSNVKYELEVRWSILSILSQKFHGAYISTAVILLQASSEQKRKRARLDQTIESEESYLAKIEVKVKVPEELKPWLVDDWDLVTRQKQVGQGKRGVLS